MKGYGFAAKKARAKESAFDGDNMIVNEATFEAMSTSTESAGQHSNLLILSAEKNKDDPKYLVLADLTPLGALDLLTKAIITRGMEILARALGGTCNPTYGLDDRISDLQPTDTQPTQWAGHFAAYKHACDKYEMQGRDGWTRAMGASAFAREQKSAQELMSEQMTNRSSPLNSVDSSSNRSLRKLPSERR